MPSNKKAINKPKLLIVEDEMITSDHLRRTLSRIGYEITGVAASGAEALDLIEQTVPDLILADIGLDGDIDGIEVAARALYGWGVPTVFLTAYSDPETMRRAKITEPYGYVLKPFKDQDLHATIEIALQQAKLGGVRRQEAQENARILVRTQDELAAMTARMIQAQETERQEIARDLHDDMVQQLALLEIDFERLWAKVPEAKRQENEGEFRKLIDRVAILANALRNVAHRLHPAVLNDLGIVVALRQLTQEFEERHLLHTRFSTRGALDNLAPDIPLCLYRIVQEALRNIAKHAGSAKVDIALVGSLDNVELTIRDDGHGFKTGSSKGRAGLGLVSMAQRAEAAGGVFEITSQLRAGTRIHVCIPIGTIRLAESFTDGVAGRRKHVAGTIT